MYRKEYGVSRGAVIWLEDGRVCCEGCRFEELVSWSGAWATIETRYGIIGLSVSPWDDTHILAAIVASQNTRYDRVVRWMKTMYLLIDEGAYHRLESVARRFGSYQAIRAATVTRLYAERRLRLAVGGLWRRRSSLLAIHGVGVKTAHAYLLFTTHAGYPVPIDRHAARVLRVGGKAPRKDLCMRYPCPTCPFRSECIVWRLYKLYGTRAGLVQTRVWLEAQDERSITRLFSATTLQGSSRLSKTRF